MKIDIPANTKTVILNIVGDEMIELKKKVEEAKQVLGLKKNWNLSEAMGHQGRYIDRVLRDGVSTNKQKEIIKTLNMMIDLNKADADCEKEIDGQFVGKDYHEQEKSELKTEIQRLQSVLVEANNHNSDLFNAGSIKNHKISCLSKDVDEEKANVRMLNGEVAELKEKLKGVRDGNTELLNKFEMWKGLAWLALVIVGCLSVVLGVVV